MGPIWGRWGRTPQVFHQDTDDFYYGLPMFGGSHPIGPRLAPVLRILLCFQLGD